jgi:SAM-dependent methyltransferase
MRPPIAYLAFLNVLAPRSPGALLDVACGTGQLLRLASGRGLQTSGVDISEEAVALARRVSPTSNVKVAPAEQLPFDDGVMNYITCLGSVEHFLDADRAIEEMIRVATVDARFLIVVPNADFLGWRIIGRHGTEQQDIRETLRSRRQWTAFFEHHNLQVERIEKDRWYLKRDVQLRRGLGGAFCRVVHRLAWAIIPLDWTYQFVFIFRQQPRVPPEMPALSTLT